MQTTESTERSEAMNGCSQAEPEAVRNGFHQIAKQDNAELKSELSVQQSRAIFSALNIPLVSESSTQQNKWYLKYRIYIGYRAMESYAIWCYY